MTKLTFKLGRYDEALAYYKTLLTYTKKAVTRNVAEKAINRVLDYVSADEGLGLDKMQEFYEITMTALEEQKNDVRYLSSLSSHTVAKTNCLSTQRLSTKTNLKLAKLWLDRHEYTRLNKVCLFSPLSSRDSHIHLPSLHRFSRSLTRSAPRRTMAPTSTRRRAPLSSRSTPSRSKCTAS